MSPDKLSLHNLCCCSWNTEVEVIAGTRFGDYWKGDGNNTLVATSLYIIKGEIGKLNTALLLVGCLHSRQDLHLSTVENPLLIILNQSFLLGWRSQVAPLSLLADYAKQDCRNSVTQNSNFIEMPWTDIVQYAMSMTRTYKFVAKLPLHISSVSVRLLKRVWWLMRGAMQQLQLSLVVAMPRKTWVSKL